MHVPDPEPSVDDWSAVPLATLADRLLQGRGDGRRWVIAVDGRGGAGKSTLGRRLAEHIPDAALAHTDDLAWHEPFFAWQHLGRELLTAFRAGGAVHLVPPQWSARGRTDAIDVPAEATVLVLEGNAASQHDLADLVDASVWVQSDVDEAERRGIARDVAEGANGTRDEVKAFWDEWQTHELPFFAADRPWERADLLVAGGPVIELADDEVAVADPPSRA